MDIQTVEFERTPLPDGETLRDGWFAVSHRFLDDDDVSSKKRNRMYRLSSDTGVTYRTLRFAANVSAGANERAAAIAIDRDGWFQLGGYRRRPATTMSLSIRPARVLRMPTALWTHSDPVQRLAFKMGLLSLSLGIGGFIVGIAALL